MDQLLQLANNAGMDAKQSEAATGGVLSFLKQNMGQDFDKISSNVSGADAAAEKYNVDSAASNGSSSGLGGLMSMASKFGGGGKTNGGGAGSLPELLAQLQGQGVGTKEVGSFMPKLADVLQKNCGVDVSSILGVSGSGSASSTSDGNNPMGSLSGMASNFLK